MSLKDINEKLDRILETQNNHEEQLQKINYLLLRVIISAQFINPKFLTFFCKTEDELKQLIEGMLLNKPFPTKQWNYEKNEYEIIDKPITLIRLSKSYETNFYIQYQLMCNDVYVASIQLYKLSTGYIPKQFLYNQFKRDDYFMAEQDIDKLLIKEYHKYLDIVFI